MAKGERDALVAFFHPLEVFSKPPPAEGSGRPDGQPLQLLAAGSHRLRLTLGQVPMAEKSNEIPALQPLLRQLPAPQGTLLTADALHCQ